MFNLGIESHDDENDACVYLIQGLANQALSFRRYIGSRGENADVASDIRYFATTR